MKPGDKVWFFDGETINEFILTGIDQREGFTRLEGHYPGRIHQHVIMAMPWPIFESREALCEHYRKIFE